MDLSRSELLLGKEGIARLQKASVCIFGMGGVGSYVAEAIGRSGIGKITLVDFDTVAPSNINRQLPATCETVGEKKAEVMAGRIRSINPDATVLVVDAFCTPENVTHLVPEACDFVVDAIDTVSAKLAIIEICKERNIPIISCMGAGNKLDATGFRVTDIYKTAGDPLCRVMRHELRKRGVNQLDVVFSAETPQKTGSKTVGSLPHVPAAAGLVAAGHVILKIARGD
ncbi:MAG: tRNA threonylcarbamoyladenosine dehydratase [Ruminococcaceae bacterium]|nr:tRNA threonylcarbamoyladenosine dehydratase [Oscillospiraceae bacterium]